MKFRRRRQRRGPLPFKYVLLITLVFFAISTGLGLWIVNKSLKPTLMDFAESQTMQIASLAVNKAVLEREAVDINKVIMKDPESSLIYFDTEKINKMRGETTQLILNNIKMAEKGDLKELENVSGFEIKEHHGEDEGLVYYIPLGKATNNVLLGNLGPNIPVRFNTIGHLEADIETKFEDIGINNVYVEVYIKLKVHVQIIIPFATEAAVLEQKIPLALGILPGEVPQFYNKGGQGVVPSLQLPVD